ncbi:hypothetical protein QAA18_04005 [Luteimonas sp. 8-5]|uniref:hypothetical protein n=1 Tax=Luteimonas sp. 8-5 TaxID=3039387 RepID=UPI0024364093|nr:hypothetical protein [Luteimonas sp. 8-5]MDG6347906.1 hypothetical protein [Luteimonas sp. 8-5]
MGWALGAAVCLSPAIPAQAAQIENTARVSYRQGSVVSALNSNTVITEVVPFLHPASVQFLGMQSDDGKTTPTPIDGGQCRVAGGSFAALPAISLPARATPVIESLPVGPASNFEVGDAIVVSVTDPNRNHDPAVREYVDVDVSTSVGDTETLRLQETAPDSGMFAAAIQGVGAPPAATVFDCVLSVSDGAQLTARYIDTGVPPNTLVANAIAHGGYVTDIRLEQIASKDIVEIGDFIQYTLIVYNVGLGPATGVEIRDLLPPGLYYRAGTLRVGDPYSATPSQAVIDNPVSGGAGITTQAASVRRASTPQAGPVEPLLEDGGRTMLFNVGDLGVGEAVKATFVAEVGAGVSSERLVNYAIATANGALSSNETDTVVRMVESLNILRFTLAGRVVSVDDCATPVEERNGVRDVRLLLQDGTFVATDADGLYHIEGLLPGTHVVQLDPATIPDGMEAVACRQHTRLAGRADSQFVEAQGGTLWRADFYLRRKGDSVGARMQVADADGKLGYTVDLDGGRIPVSKLRAMVKLPDGADLVPGSATVDGAAIGDPEINGGIAIFDLGDPGTNWRRRLAFRVDAGGAGCPPEGHASKLVGMFEADGASARTPPIDLAIRCAGADGPADSGRVETRVTAAAAESAASPYAALGKIRASIAEDSVAAGAREPGTWFAGQSAGRDWLFPAADYNPRSPTTRAVVKHLPGEKVRLTINGEEVGPLRYEGGLSSADKTMAISRWRGIGLVEGRNVLRAEVVDANGTVVASLERVVAYSNIAARVELVPERSILAADGHHRPVVAIRVLDRLGNPVRKGTAGSFELEAPYQPAMSEETRQERQMIGNGGGRPSWVVEGDDGVAYIELQPTSTAGSATFAFQFENGRQAPLRQELQVWLKSAPRDWVVVGFAKGSVGYETLEDNMQALPPGEDGKGLRGEGQVALYAKGRVMGKWLLTLAYDTDKDNERLRNPSLLSTIDPGQYYTLYGDGAQQGYDAASARKLYLKLERDQFYVLFGDYQSGMDRNELSRYQRTLNGMKVEYRGPLLDVNAFAARTSQSHARDEIQGDGTSGLYRLKQRGIVMNSERIRIETRDRYHSEQILDTREMVRHIDYDIDYENGTLLFRQPIASRDFDFNPVWIVAEYETQGTGEEFLNGGARVGVRAMDGRLEAGASYIRDEDSDARGQLAGIDAKFRLTVNDELRAEAATSRVDGRQGDAEGNAWLVEWEHRGETLNFLVYARRQGPGFGLGQQNRFESGMFKTGVQGQYRLGNDFSLQGEVYRQEDLSRGLEREVATLEASYRADRWSANAGLKMARDESAQGEVAESRQVTLGASRLFMDGRLELGAQAEVSLGGKNDSVDFPTRVQVNSAFKVNDKLRLLAAQEFTDGKDRDTSTTRVGFEASPWKDATLTSTLNQSRISEYGPRTFALFGLNQRFVVSERWSFDVGVDSSRSFDESGDTPLVVDPSQPIQAGGMRDGGALTEDYVALTGGMTFRTDLWMWNARLEGRNSEQNDRYGFTTAFLRQIRDGVAMSASAQAFSQHNEDGSTGILANAQLSWAWRPLGGNWSMLDKLEYRLDQLKGGTGEAILGNATIAATGNARSARLINNFVLNYASAAWAGDDGAGSVLDLYQRSQLSIYYGSKYVIDSYGPDDYAGYSDLLGAEYRFDLTPRIDVGIRASLMHSWSQDTYAWAFGPSLGFTPFTNAWVSVGYNVRGFNDRDFESSHYTAQGAYLVFRMKFDQGTFGLDRARGAAH